MFRKTLATSEYVTGKWDANVPVFMSSRSGQEKFDFFMAMKYNITNSKLAANLLHRFLGDYQEKNKVYFTDVFKQLKQWLFGTYRTEQISQLAYLAINKGFNTYKQLTRDMIIADKLYNQDIALMYPEEEYMCVSTQRIEVPIYFTHKPRQIFLENKNMMEDVTSAFYKAKTQEEKDIDDDGEIPKAKTLLDSNIQTLKMFEYMNRNFVTIPCDYCRRNLTIHTLGHTTCSHMCHKGCLGHGYQCYCCEMESSYFRGDTK